MRGWNGNVYTVTVDRMTGKPSTAPDAELIEVVPIGRVCEMEAARDQMSAQIRKMRDQLHGGAECAVCAMVRLGIDPKDCEHDEGCENA